MRTGRPVVPRPISIDGRTIFLGGFKDENLASQAYNENAFLYHKEFASPNHRIIPTGEYKLIGPSTL
jgi:hypothetical protein